MVRLKILVSSSLGVALPQQAGEREGGAELLVMTSCALLGLAASEEPSVCNRCQRVWKLSHGERVEYSRTLFPQLHSLLDMQLLRIQGEIRTKYLHLLKTALWEGLPSPVLAVVCWY